MCTAISFTTRQRHRFVGRTMDFPTRSTPWQLGYLPIDYQWQSLPECDSFANDYAILGGMRRETGTLFSGLSEAHVVVNVRLPCKRN